MPCDWTAVARRVRKVCQALKVMGKRCAASGFAGVLGEGAREGRADSRRRRERVSASRNSKHVDGCDKSSSVTV